MIAIITEKPSTAHAIARVVGASERCGGWLQGGGYAVTWCGGEALSLAKSAARRRAATFKLVARDKATARQLGVIRRVLAKCEGVIAAADPSPEGELLIRNVLVHLGCTLPVQRLWLTALTEEHIYKGISSLRDDAEFDNLHAAAEYRAKADWLVRANAGAEFGRLETPVLAAIALRYMEHTAFQPANYWIISATLGKKGALQRFCLTRDIHSEARAERLADVLKTTKEATVTRVERKTLHEPPPRLFDLLTLQIECFERHGMSANQTLRAARALYEKGLITFPCTSSCHIPPDTMRHLPSLLQMILRMETFAGITLDTARLTRRNIGGSQGHHAILITGDYVQKPLLPSEERVYNAICKRMLDAFAPRPTREKALIQVRINGLNFRADTDNLNLAEGDVLAILGHSLARRKTQPPPLYTEISLLSLLADNGLGTPASRSAIIETLLKKGQIARSEDMQISGDLRVFHNMQISGDLGVSADMRISRNSLIPTSDGLNFYEKVKNLRIADLDQAALWEQSLASIESGTMNPETFMRAFTVHLNQILQEL